MTEVILHVYDVTNSESEKTNNTIVQIRKIFKDGIGLGGIFHSAIQVYGEDEWSFGFCEQGTGVFSCPSGENPMYTYRWVNCFANAGDTAIEIAGTTAFRLRQAKAEIVSASKVAYRFLVGVTSGSSATNDSPGNSNGGRSPRFQADWFKNIVNPGPKPSTSTEIETLDQCCQERKAHSKR